MEVPWHERDEKINNLWLVWRRVIVTHARQLRYRRVTVTSPSRHATVAKSADKLADPESIEQNLSVNKTQFKS